MKRYWGPGLQYMNWGGGKERHNHKKQLLNRRIKKIELRVSVASNNTEAHKQYCLGIKI